MAAEHPIPSAHRYGSTSIDVTVPVVRRISWGAVIAGVVMALVVQVLLAMLGTGIGLSTMDPATGGSPDAQTLGMGAGIWWALSMLIATFIGGWVAGHMAGLPAAADGRLHGLLVWGLSTLLMLYLLTSTVGGVIGGAFNLMGTAANTAAQSASNATPGVLGGIVEQAKGVARDAGVNVDAQRPGQVLNEAQKAEAAQRAREAADTAASAGARAGLWGFVALLLGAIAAAWGGAAGRPKDGVVATR